MWPGGTRWERIRWTRRGWGSPGKRGRWRIGRRISGSSMSPVNRPLKLGRDWVWVGWIGSSCDIELLIRVFVVGHFSPATSLLISSCISDYWVWINGFCCQILQIFRPFFVYLLLLLFIWIHLSDCTSSIAYSSWLGLNGWRSGTILDPVKFSGVLSVEQSELFRYLNMFPLR